MAKLDSRNDEHLTIIAKPHPFSGDVVTAMVPAGSTISEIVGPGAVRCRVEIGGIDIAPEWWPRIRPKPSTAVVVTRFPQGGMGGKDILRLVAFAALAVFTAGIGTGAIFGLMGLTALGTAAGVGIAGALLINALIPPQKPATAADTSVTQLNAITGSSNQANLWGSVPCLFGTMRMFPTLAALPFSEISGNDQYVRFLFDAGYGVPDISDMKIGNDDLANFTDVETQIGTPINLIPDSDGTLITWALVGGSMAFSSSGGAIAGGKWTYTSTGAASGFHFFKSAPITVVPGQTCTISGYIDGTHVIAGNPTWGAWDLSVVTNYLSVGQGVGVNGRISGSFTVPPGVTQLVIICDTSNCTVASAQQLAFSNPQLELGSTASAYQSTIQNLFADDISEVAETDALNTDGTQIVHTTGPNADELSVDVVFPSGLFGVDANGKAINVTCNVRIEISPTGLGSWSSLASLPGGLYGIGLTISNAAATPVSDVFAITSSARVSLRVGFRWKTNTAWGSVQFDVRVTRVSTNWNGAAVGSRFGDLTWAVLRTIRHTSPSTTGTQKVALRIKATDQLNGTINQFNMIAAQPIPVWNGTAWVAQIVSNNNPAYVLRWLLCDCPGNPRRVSHSRVDDTALIAWGAECTTKEFTFDAVADAPTTVFALIQDICAAGRATFTVRNSLYSVVRDIAQTVPVQHFTPRNSWGFAGSRSFLDQVQALRVQFVNPEANYQNDEIVVYDDGFSADGAGGTTIATAFETFQIRGCTNANGAWRLGRYHLAVARLRPNLYTWNADIEHIVCNRGDFVKLAHDVISVGTAWGRLKTATGSPATAVTVDEGLSISPSLAYSIRIRANDGSTHLTSAVAVPKNYLIDTSRFDNAVWQHTLIAGATAATVIPNATASPNGSIDADKIIFAATSGTQSDRFFQAATIPAPSVGSNYCGAVWLRADVPCTVFVLLKKANGGGTTTGAAVTCNVTTQWKQYFCTGDASSDSGTVLCFVISQLTSSPGATVYAWHSSLEPGTTPSVTDPTLVVRQDDNFEFVTSLTLVTPQSGVNPGDLFLFGISGQESIDMLITKIEPSADLTAKITAVDSAPAVLAADSGTPPTLTSSITGAPWNDAPPPPDLLIITSGETQNPPNDGGINDPVIKVGVGQGPSGPIRTPPPRLGR